MRMKNIDAKMRKLFWQVQEATNQLHDLAAEHKLASSADTDGLTKATATVGRFVAKCAAKFARRVKVAPKPKPKPKSAPKGK